MSEQCKIVENGWKQGTIVCSADRCQFAKNVAVGEILIVISQDCDILHSCFDVEPYVSVLRGRQIENLDGNLTYGKNPRKLQITVKNYDGEQKNVEISANGMLFCDRKLLQKFTSSSKLSIADTVTRQICSWMVARYNRFAMPDTFVDRMRDKKEKISKILKLQAKSICGIYISIKPMTEMASDRSYSIVLIGSLQTEHWESAEIKSESKEAMARIAEHLDSCEGIDVEESEIKSEADISFADRRYLQRWDFDYMSFKSGETAPVPSCN